MPVISIRTLGPVSAQLDGGPMPAELLWRKHLALLVYLARSPHRARSREHLLNLLWGEKSEASARHSLNEAVRLVRRHAGAHALDTARGQVALADGVVVLDTERLAALDPAADADALGALVGGEFMEGFGIPGATPFEEWLAAERAHWCERATELLRRAAEASLERCNPTAAAALSARAAALSPCSDHVMRVVLRSFALEGRAVEALVRYDAFVRRLAEQMGAAASADTAGLADRLRRGVAGGRERLPAGAPVPPVTVPMEGRASELASVLEVLRESRDARRSAACLIEGQGGSGRTRLQEEVITRAALDGWHVVTARAVAADVGVAWSGVTGVAEGGLIALPGAVAAPPSAVAALAALSPRWAERFGASRDAPPLPPGDALAECLQAAADEAPVLLAVDDAHWLDPDSLAALLRAVRRAERLPLVVLLTVEQGLEPPLLLELRRHLGGSPPGRAIHLGPLGEDAMERMAGRMLPSWDHEQRGRLVRRIAADTAGSPLFVVALLKAIAAGLELGRLDGHWPAPDHTLDHTFPAPVPDPVVAAVRVNFRRLPAPAQRVLEAAAVLGDRSSEAFVARGADLELEATRQALDELERQRWLAADARGYGFPGRLMRDLVLNDLLTEGQRRRIRERAGVT